MASRTKQTNKKIHPSKKSTGKENKEKYVPLRDQNSAKLSVGDSVSHGLRNKRIRATIILLGDEDECKNSLKIIERTKKPPSSAATTNKNTINEDDENDENDVNDEEQQGHDESEEVNKDNEIQTFDETDDIEGNDDEPSVSHTGALTIITPNGQSTTALTPLSSGKRKSLVIEQSNSVSRKRVKNVGFVSMKEHAKVVDQLAVALEHNEMYQSTWMRRVLSGGTINADNDDDEYVEKGELLDLIMNTLGMTEAELNVNTGKSTLSTARQVIGAKYPGENVIYADVEKEHIKAVVEYAWLMHPAEKNNNDFSKISKAMGNVFATRTYSKKEKNTVTVCKANTSTDG